MPSMPNVQTELTAVAKRTTSGESRFFIATRYCYSSELLLLRSKMNTVSLTRDIRGCFFCLHAFATHSCSPDINVKIYKCFCIYASMVPWWNKKQWRYSSMHSYLWKMEWSASRSDGLTSWEKPPDTDWIAHCLGTRVLLDAVEKTLSPLLGIVTKLLGHAAHGLAIILRILRYLRSCNHSTT
jgi:hypothetical protein